MTIERRTRARQIEQQAEGYLEFGMYQQALDTLKRLGDTEQYSSHALYLCGEALRGLERYQEALMPLEKVAQVNPESAHVWLALGWCHKRTARLDLAIEDLQAALKAEPTGALLHYNLACYFSLAGKKKPALAHLATALQIDSQYRSMIATEPDFDPIRADPEFQAITSVVASASGEGESD